MRGDTHKFDANKPMWDLLPLKEVEKIVYVLTYGADKYKPDGWKGVPQAKERYLAAALRHLCAYQSGEPCDAESGLSHLAHAACCLVFLLYFESHDQGH